jgi:hypothetical protein
LNATVAGFVMPCLDVAGVSRILIIAGGARGRALGGNLVTQGHAVRITTREEAGRGAIEAVGAECWIGTPDRIATLRYALEGVSLACWLLGNACGDARALRALHGSRLEFFVSQTIDTTIRGLVYEAAGSVAPEILAAGRALIVEKAAFNAIALEVLDADPRDLDRWSEQAGAVIERLLSGSGARYTGGSPLIP